MPELPEVEIVRRGLVARIPGEIIKRVEVYRAQSIAYPAMEEFISSLPGYEFVDVTRRGKYLILHLKENKRRERNAYLVIHLRMSGRLLLLEKGKKVKEKARFLRVQIFLESGKQLLFDDMRVFGRLWYVKAEKDLLTVVSGLSKLGIEPLGDISSKQLRDLFKGRRQAIKSILLNQSLITGIGNIYADEILFQAGIHPLMPAGKLTSVQSKRLAQIIPITLERAIKLGGSSIKDFVDSEGVNGNYQHESYVYGRAGKACRKCKTKIERIKLAGRSAYFCPKCQKQ